MEYYISLHFVRLKMEQRIELNKKKYPATLSSIEAVVASRDRVTILLKAKFFDPDGKEEQAPGIPRENKPTDLQFYEDHDLLEDDGSLKVIL